MPALKKRIQVQVDRKLADEGDAVLRDLGINPTTAITMFYKRLVARGGLPFSTELTQREKDELAIQRLTMDWPTENLDTPEKIKAWVDKDECEHCYGVRSLCAKAGRETASRICGL